MIFLVLIFSSLMVLLISQYSMVQLGQANGNTILAVNLPEKYLKDLTINLIAREYTLSCYKIFYRHLIALIIFIFTRNYVMISTLLTLVYCISLSIFYMLSFDKYRKQIIKIKREQNLYHGDKHIVTIDTQITKIKDTFLLSRKHFIPPIVITIIFATIMFSNQTNIEIMISIPIFLLVLLSVTNIVTYEILMRMPTKLYSEDTDLNIALNKSFKMEWSRAFIISMYTNIAYIPIFIMSNRYNYNEYILVFGILIVSMLTVVVMIIAYNRVKNSRNELLELSQSDKNQYYLDDDDNYILGGLYYNKNNSSTFVEKRVLGMGLTINLATKLGQLYAIITGIMMIGLIFFLITQIPLDFWKGTTFTQNGDIITINAPSYVIDFDINDIVSIEILEELPNLLKINGVATNTIYLGNFLIKDEGSAKIYINRNVKKYIYITLSTDERIILNGENIEVTDNYYLQLS